MTFLLEPFAGMTADALLQHYQSRRGVRCVEAVADPSQTSRAKTDAILGGRFEFNGEVIEPSAGFWVRNASRDIEWFILLHKFYYAAGLAEAFTETGDERYWRKWVELTDSWIAADPLTLLPNDVTGRRVQNWIFAHHRFVAEARAPIPADFHARFLQSLHAQVSHLRAHLTPSRNHRTIELYALFLAAVLFPEMRDSAAWLDFSRQELATNAERDLRPDGVHVEQSTDYHHLALRNWLAARRLALHNGIEMPPSFDESLRRALDFAKWIHKPDGAIPSLSDGDSGSYLELLQQGYDLYADEELLYVATGGTRGCCPPEQAKLFPDGGYTILRSGWGQHEPFANERYLIFDCGPLGEGNHGHLDLLHFEMAAYGRSLVVDPGRYTYHEGDGINWRVRFRGTCYHNTVTVDERNQTRYEFHKRKFKIRGPEPAFQLHTFRSAEGCAFLHGSCRSHEYDALHERRIWFVRGLYWVIRDTLTAPNPHIYDLRFHLSPEAQGVTTAQGATASAPGLVIAGLEGVRQALTVDDGFVSPSYGHKLAAPVVRFRQQASDTEFVSVLYPFSGKRPAVQVSMEADAIKVSVDGRVDRLNPDGIVLESTGARDQQ
ncbi:MAG: alginate lyase family protein [Bryobacteraceae bacterium]